MGPGKHTHRTGLVHLGGPVSAPIRELAHVESEVMERSEVMEMKQTLTHSLGFMVVAALAAAGATYALLHLLFQMA